MGERMVRSPDLAAMDLAALAALAIAKYRQIRVMPCTSHREPDSRDAGARRQAVTAHSPLSLA
jgi:hypothetical protein